MFRPCCIARPWGIACLMAVVLSSQPTLARTVYVSAASTAQVPDGSSWNAAFSSIQDGVNAAAPDGEVWVAAGLYTQPLTLAQGVQVYGGFAGNETDRSQRQARANESLIQGAQITAGPDVLPAAILDGFTIRGADPEMVCSSCSPTIRNNIFKDSSWAYGWMDTQGGAIRCMAGANPIISNNLIVSCYAFLGGALYIQDSSPIVVSNTLYMDGPLVSGDGMSTGSGTVYITGTGSKPDFANNIVYPAEFTNNATTPGAPTFRNNLFYAYWSALGTQLQHFENMPDPTGTNGNITNADPAFVNSAHRDFRLQLGSPCVDAGDDSAVTPWEPDIYGAPRIQGAHVDIGAAESDGLPHTAPPWVLHVSPNGNNNNDGLTWQTAKGTISGATSATSAGDEIWVQAGTYTSTSGGVANGVGLYGGFAGTETTRDQRDSRANGTVLIGAANATVVYVSGSAIVDGFTIRSAKPSTGTPTDVGIQSYQFTGRISNNIIEAHGAGGVLLAGPGTPEIRGNIFRGNSSRFGGGLHLVTQCNALVADNLFFANRAFTSGTGTGAGGGLGAVSSCAPTIVNNTFVANSAAASGGALCAGVATLANNVLAYNSTGAVLSAGSRVVCNDVYANGSYDYQGVADPTGADGNLRADPRFAAYTHTDFRIQPDSPCRDAGDPSFVNATDVDLDGGPRTFGPSVDIGAYESDGTVFPTPAPRIVRVSPNGDDANDGQTWAAPKKTVQAAVNAAGSGGETWVAAGTYTEHITLQPFTSLYGGFNGEEDRSLRDLSAHVSTLDGQSRGSVITARGCMGGVIDGFTIKNGSSSVGGEGGGIVLDGASMIVSHNVLTANRTAITCTNGDTSTISGNQFGPNTVGAGATAIASSSSSSSPTIAGNTFSGITGPNGNIVACTTGSPVVAGNIFTANGATSSAVGTAVSALTGSAVIRDNVIAWNTEQVGVNAGAQAQVFNNTVVGNAGTGISATTGALVANNVVAWNKAYGLGSTSGATFRRNCVYGNTSGAYTGFSYSGTDPNLKVDPRLASVPGKDAHIQPSSPCIDAGDDSLVSSSDTDADGSPRIRGAHVDIGAYESTGIWFPAYAIRVSPNGDDANDGLSWAAPKKTVQSAIDALFAVGPGDVWVAAGTYVGNITFRAKMNLLGGFAGTETNAGQRDPRRNVTVLDGNSLGVVVTCSGDGAIDGFTIRNGAAVSGSSGTVSDSGGAIRCNGSSPTISHNVITRNSGRGVGGISVFYGTPSIVSNTITANSGQGITVTGAALITDNVITLNNATSSTSSIYGGGIYCMAGSPVIARNVFAGNVAAAPASTTKGCGGAVYCAFGTTATITNNTFRGNAADSGGALYLAGGATVRDNVFVANRAASGGAIFASAGAPVVTNNSVVGNTTTSDYGSINWATTGGTLANNIIAFNSSGVSTTSTSLAPRSNDVFSNASWDYKGLADQTGLNGNINADPFLVNADLGDAHLRQGSPCIDAGDNSVPVAGETDIDGEARSQGAGVDIGADEFNGTTPSLTMPIVRVSPTGDDQQDGASWPHAMRTVGAAINSLAESGGEVWVSAGTYNERVLLLSLVSIYGGFAGTESTRAERNAVKNLAILDGGQRGAVVSANGVTSSTVDGLVIRNGSNSGVYLQGSRILLTNNIIAGNGGASGYGANYFGTPAGGVRMEASDASTIVNNRIEGNLGTGVQMYMTSSVRIAGNVITGNTDGVDCWPNATVINNTIAGNQVDGIKYYATTPSPVIANNIVAFNAIGVIVANVYSAHETTLQNNCVYGNTKDFVSHTDQTGANGNIKTDPKLAGLQVGNLHIQPFSPCRDAGADTFVLPGDLDADGRPRIQGAHVDIGAYESDLRLWTNSVTVVRARPSGDDSNDGTSWSAAKRTVQAALDALYPGGGQVWVAEGLYNERITVGPYAHLLGGFAGNESAASERNWAAHPTVLDGGGAGSVVSLLAGATYSSVDGISIRNGAAAQGGGVFAAAASFEVAHCVISDCTAFGTTVKAGNTTQTFNAMGGGLYGSGTGVVQDCIFLRNSAEYGAACWVSTASIISNTAVGNTSTHIWSTQMGALYGGTLSVLANNIVAFNSGGGISSSSANATLIRNNDAFANGGDYVNITTGVGDNGNISRDPRFISIASGDYHLRQTSPCVDAGDDTVAQASSLDVFAQPRIAALHVDMGAAESPRPKLPFSTPIVRVAPNGDDGNDGTSWDLPKRTIGGALSDVLAPGGEIWVAAGTYIENVNLSAGVGLYAGFAGNETSRDQRDIAAHPTVLDGGATGSVVRIAGGAGPDTVLDGFTIRNGSGSLVTSGTSTRKAGGGVLIDGGSPVIRNNTFTSNTADLGGALYSTGLAPLIEGNVFNSNTMGVSGGAIYCDAASPIIHANTFSDNGPVAGTSSANEGGAILCSGGNPMVSSNTFARNKSGNYGGAIRCLKSVAEIGANRFEGNSATYGSAISCDDGTDSVHDNVVVGSLSAILPVQFGGMAVFLANGNFAVTNNTILGNTGNAVFITMTAPHAPMNVTIKNNIYAYNGYGIDVEGSVNAYVRSSIVIFNNLAWDNANADYTQIADPTGINGNLHADPLFADLPHGDLRIQPNSPARDAGDDTAIASGETDAAGKPRLLGAHVDIGAFESDGTAFPGELKVIRVRPDGDDANDGATWATARKTIAGACGLLTGGHEVWVAEGTYKDPVVLALRVKLYGGFAGTETDLNQRNPRAHPTVISYGKRDATGWLHAAISMARSCQDNVIDGFTFRDSGGIECVGTGLRVSNNAFEHVTGDAVALDSGAQLDMVDNVIQFCDYGVSAGNAAILTAYRNRFIGCTNDAVDGGLATLTIRDNIIAANGMQSSGSQGGGIYADQCTIQVANNTIVANQAANGGGLFIAGGTGTVANNIIAFNSSGVYVAPDVASTVTFVSNCVFGNTDYNVSPPYRVSSNGNIAADPLLFDLVAGDFRLRPESPCRNAGNPAYVQPGDTDASGGDRVLDGRVDIGALECDDALPPASSRIVRVKPDGNDTLDGSSWDLAKRTIQAALDAGGEVWVAAGNYNGPFAMGAFSTMYGGFAGTETSRLQRAPSSNSTILNGDGLNPVIQFKGGLLPTVIDGFVLLNGAGTPVWNTQNGIVGQGGNVIVSNNAVNVPGMAISVSGVVKVQYNTITKSVPGSGWGIGCGGSGIVSDNVLWYNSLGIDCSGGPFTVTRNRIFMATGTGDQTAGGIWFAASGEVSRNVIEGTNSHLGPALELQGQPQRIVDNLIADNHVETGSPGIDLDEPDPSVVIANNTLVHNTTSAVGDIWGGAIRVMNSGSPVIVNNTLANNTSNVTVMNDAPTMHNNLFWGATDYDYVFNYASASIPTNNIKADPLLDSSYHPQTGSPCINAGDNTLVAAGDLDLGGLARIGGGRVDIGAYEYGVAGISPLSALQALRISGGLDTPEATVTGVADTQTRAEANALVGTVDIVEAVRLARQAAGLGPVQ